ncbi:MAG: hypothetical protein FWF73_00075 [Spirochaetes bacterium]|nr:hypothetical protein [Spirochaetota bacterium]
MDIAVYERVWKYSIQLKIDRMLQADTDIFFVEGQVKDKIWLTYEDYKNKVHSYMHNPDGRIDRHKSAATMLYSIEKWLLLILLYLANSKNS